MEVEEPSRNSFQGLHPLDHCEKTGGAMRGCSDRPLQSVLSDWSDPASHFIWGDTPHILLTEASVSHTIRLRVLVAEEDQC
jgi:hypothetical protein